MIKTKNILLSFVIFVAILFFGGLLYILEKEVGLEKVAGKYLNRIEEVEEEPKITDRELQYIRQLVDLYYTMNSSQSSEEKTQLLKPHFSKLLRGNVFPKYRQMVSFFVANGGSQSIDLEKINFILEDKRYDVYLKVIQKIPKEKPSRHLVHLKVKIENHADGNKVTYWSDKILKYPSRALQNDSVFLKKGAISSIKFPCNILSVAPIENENQIDVNLDSISNIVKFHSKGDISKNSVFRANCKSRYYNLSINDTSGNITLFQDLTLADGITKRRKLTPVEKRRLSIKRQLKNWGLQVD